MPACARQRGRQREVVVPDRVAPDNLGTAEGERARLVEKDGIDGGKAFHSNRLQATTCTAGTASPSAQGQVMMSTATPISSASRNGSPPKLHQPAKASSASPCTTGA